MEHPAECESEHIMSLIFMQLCRHRAATVTTAAAAAAAAKTWFREFHRIFHSFSFAVAKVRHNDYSTLHTHSHTHTVSFRYNGI